MKTAVFGWPRIGDKLNLPRQAHEQQRDVGAVEDEDGRDDRLDHPVLCREQAGQD